VGFVEEIDRYLSFLSSQRGYSALTIKSYHETFHQAKRLLHYEITENGVFFDASHYRLSLSEQNKRTIARKMAALRSLVAFWRNEGRVITVKGLESVKISRLLPKPVQTDEIIEVLKEVNDDLKVVISVMYGVGLRMAEVCELKCGDISNGWLTVKGKGGFIRQLPLLPSINELVNVHCKERKKDDPLFYLNGKKLSQNSLRYHINKIFMKRGLHVTPHQLRHTFATDLLNHGARINDVSELLGHKHLSTTQIYTHVSRSKKVEEYTFAHPMCRQGNL
jgi:integrase/recombinase XerC